jgi:phage-related protein
MHGIKFGEIHSYDDLHLILSKVEIPPAGVKTTYVDIPGGDGSVDLTEGLGRICYKDRKCKFTFTVAPGDDFEAKKKEVSNLLNGQRFEIVLDKDPGYKYIGRCAVNSYSTNKALHKIVVEANVAPYKLKKTVTAVVMEPGEKVSVTLENGRMWTVPEIVTTAPATIEFNGGTFALTAGTHKILELELKPGENHLLVTCVHTVTFHYQEGDL